MEGVWKRDIRLACKALDLKGGDGERKSDVQLGKMDSHLNKGLIAGRPTEFALFSPLSSAETANGNGLEFSQYLMDVLLPKRTRPRIAGGVLPPTF